MIKEAIVKLSKKEDLSYAEAEAVMDEITVSAFGMRAHCVKLLHEMDVLEIVGTGGTGGDGSNSFNISTTAAMVIAAGGMLKCRGVSLY